MMELMMEFFFTASLSLVLAFFFAKLVSMASDDKYEHVFVSRSKKKEKEISRIDEEQRFEGEVMNQGLEIDNSVEFVDESVKSDEFEENTIHQESEKIVVEDEEKAEIVGFVEADVVGVQLEKQEEMIVKDESNDANQGFETAKEKREEDVEKEGLFNEDDDWEGIEKSEVEKVFGAASKFVTSVENNDLLSKLGNDIQMQLYGLHKVAMEGPCREPPPLALMVSSRAKWNAWQRLGNMSPEVAMEQYVNLLSGGIPGWVRENPEGDYEQDKGNGSPEAGGSRTEGHESLSIHQPDSKSERKPKESWPLGEGGDTIGGGKSL